MPIKRTRAIIASQALPRLGWIHKGIHVGHPMDTDRFWISFDPLAVADPEAAMKAWQGLNGLQPFAHLSDKELKEALKNPEHNFAPLYLNNVYVISNQFDDDDSYRSFYEKHIKTNAGKRVMTRRCTGEHIVAEMREDAWGIYNRSHKPCARVLAEAAGKDPNKACDCKLEGHLRLIIPALLDAAKLPHGYFELETSAWRDDTNIYTALGYTQQNWGDPYGNPLSHIPFQIWRERTEYSYLDAKGKSAQKIEYVIRMSATDEYMEELRNQKPIVLVRQIPSAEAPVFEDEAEEWVEASSEAETDYNEAEETVTDSAEFSGDEKLVSDLDKTSARYLGLPSETILQHFACKTYSDFFAKFPSWDAISAAVTRMLTETELPVRVYGVRTIQKDESSVKYLLNFGFGMVYAHSRDAFANLKGYDKNQDYTSVVNGKAVKRNLRFLGDHFFSEVFGRDYVLVRLKLNGNNNLDIAEIIDPETIPF
jgi:hypothetical protein